MRRLKRLLRMAAWLGLTGCAHIAFPPGGPSRNTPPILVATYPDSVRVLPDFRGRAEFRFDEVVSEGSSPNFGYGNGTLEMLVMLSPDTAVPSVEWHRNHLSVRPKHGWRPNTVYRIELLPGLADLQPSPNVTKTTSVITFATGGPLPTRYLTGRAIDWGSVQAVPRALIDAFHLPDSAGYRTMADSTGRFRLGPLPDGPYLVEAVSDQDRNHRQNGKEPWDTVRIPATRDSVGEIWMYLQDTLPPRVQQSVRQDSVSITMTFAEPIDPNQRIAADSIRVLALPDSGTIGPVDALPKALNDSIQKARAPRAARADSVARADSLTRDSLARVAASRPPTREERAAAAAAAAAKANLPQQHRPVLGNALVIHTTGIVHFGTRYYIEVRGVRTASGVVGRAIGTLDVPKPTVTDTATKVDSLTVRIHADSIALDSARAKGDTARADSLQLRLRADSTTRAKAPAKPPAKPDTTASHPALPARKPDALRVRTNP